MKIATVIGARPQFIKAAPVSRALASSHQEIIIHTGQHYDQNMSEVFFEQLQVPRPRYNLGIGSGSHGSQTGAMLAAIEEIIIQEKPELVLVYGDTNSTLAGALAAAKLHFPVAHVEAGIRSFNRTMPEELNRVLTDNLADLLFCPTQTAVTNLTGAGITKGVFLTGDVMYDSLLFFLQRANYNKLQELQVSQGKYFLATIHRPQNTDEFEALKAIIAVLNQLEVPIVFPLHPRTRGFLEKFSLMSSIQGNVKLIDPVGYLDMLALMEQAALILTDSGGIQKEAYLLGVPCITLRRDTEWPETVEAGWNTLTGVNIDEILEAVGKRPHGQRQPIFGDGKAASKIVQILENCEG